MSRFTRSITSAVLIAAIASLVSALGVTYASSASAATKAPYSDPNATGYIGFCDAQGHQVTSGSITTHPFVYHAVSSIPAPQGYGPPYGRATLYVYQPIQYVDPSDWSGEQLTAGTAFSNPAVPMTEGTIGDHSMGDFSSVYPLHYQNFAEVRIYYTAVGQVQFSSTYPAANLQITGNTWTQVGGGKVNCGGGKAHSDEAILGTRTNAPTAPVTPITEGLPTPGNPHTAALPSTSGSTAVAGSGSGTSGSDQTAGASQQSTSSSSSTGLIVLIIVVVVVLAAGGSYYVRRRVGRASN